MSEFDELVASPGVVMAGRFGPDGRIAEYKSKSLYVAIPASAEMAQWFCAAISMMFRSMAHVVDLMDQSGFNQTSWLPVHSWTYSGGDYAIAVHGDRPSLVVPGFEATGPASLLRSALQGTAGQIFAQALRGDVELGLSDCQSYAQWLGRHREPRVTEAPER